MKYADMGLNADLSVITGLSRFALMQCIKLDIEKMGQLSLLAKEIEADRS